MDVSSTFDEDDSAYGEDVTSDYAEGSQASEFTSINSTKFKHSWENGRRYQGYLQDRYGLPNDDAEQLREGLKHKLYTDYLLPENGLIIAPVGDHPQKIVDLGTGAGFWAQDVAEKYPSARVIGTDLSPIQPLWSPPNAEFRVEDLEDETRDWTGLYEDADLFHIRALLQTLRDPNRLLEKAFRNLRPGGWIQIHEVIPRVVYEQSSASAAAAEAHPLNVLYKRVEGPFADKYGWTLHITNDIPRLLQDVGFINIESRVISTPLGVWQSEPRQREIGSFVAAVYEDWVAAILAKYELLGFTPDEANKLGQDIVDSFVAPGGMIQWMDCWAQKPPTS